MNHYQNLNSKPRNSIKTFIFEAIGTKWIIDLDLYNLRLDTKFIQDKILYTLNDFELKYSRFRTDSFLYSLRNKLGKFKVGSEFVQILSIYKYFYDLTSGLFSPLCGSVLENLGYDKDYSFEIRNNTDFQIPSFDNAIKIIDLESIELLQKISFDFGALGKGFLIDKVYNLLINLNINYFIINAGGDIRFYSNNTDDFIDIVLEHPLDTGLIIGNYALKSTKAICSSSTIKRAWKGKNHIIDLDKKDSVQSNVISSFVVYDNACFADALATICLLPNAQNFRINKNFESLIIFKDLSCKFTDGFKNCLF